jgi:hypothetical protein
MSTSALETAELSTRPKEHYPSKPPPFSYERLQWRGGSDVQIRILVLKPAPSLEHPIICHLQTFYDSEQPHSEALSYSWGDATQLSLISLNGLDFQVTKNLESALRYLRRPEQERRLWIDAISINQLDLDEKSEIVRHMYVCYNHAEQTIIWLGHEDENTGLGFDLIRTAGTNFKDVYTDEKVDDAIDLELKRRLPSSSKGESI